MIQHWWQALEKHFSTYGDESKAFQERFEKEQPVQAIPLLWKHMEEGAPHQCHRCVDLLLRLRSPLAKQTIQKVLSLENPYKIIYATKALLKLNSATECLQPLIKLLENHSDPPISQLVSAIRSTELPEAISYLQKLCTEEASYKRREAAIQLSPKFADERVIEILKQEFESKESHIIGQPAYALDSIGTAELREYFQDHLQSSGAYQRYYAAVIIEKDHQKEQPLFASSVHHKAKEVILTLLQETKDTNLLEAIGEDLQEWRWKEAAPVLRSRCHLEEKSFAMYYLFVALIKIEKEAGLAFYETLLPHEDAWIRREAAFAIIQWGDEAQKQHNLQVVESLFETEDYDFAEGIILGILEDSLTPSTIPLLARYYRTDCHEDLDDTSKQIIDAYIQLGGDIGRKGLFEILRFGFFDEIKKVAEHLREQAPKETVQWLKHLIQEEKDGYLPSYVLGLRHLGTLEALETMLLGLENGYWEYHMDTAVFIANAITEGDFQKEDVARILDPAMEKILQNLGHGLQSSDDESSMKAVEQLAHYGLPSFWELAGKFGEQYGIGWKIAEMIARSEQAEAVPALAQLLGSYQTRVQDKTAFVLGRMKIPEAKAAIFATLENEDRWFRKGAVMALREHNTPDAIERLLYHMGDEDDDIHVEARNALKDMVFTAHDAILSHMRTLHTQYQEQRSANDGGYVQLSDRMRKSIRGCCWLAGEVKSDEAIPLLAYWYEHERIMLGTGAAKALGKIRNQQARTHLLSFLDREHSFTSDQEKLVHIIAEADLKEAIPILQKQLADVENKSLELEILLALYQLGDRQHKATIVERLDSADKRTTVRAARVFEDRDLLIEQLGKTDSLGQDLLVNALMDLKVTEAIPKLKQVYQESDDFMEQLEYAMVLGYLGDDTGRSTLVEATKHGEAWEYPCFAARGAMGLKGVNQYIINQLRSSEEADARIDAFISMGQYEDDFWLGHIKPGLTDEHPAVRMVLPDILLSPISLERFQLTLPLLNDPSCRVRCHTAKALCQKLGPLQKWLTGDNKHLLQQLTKALQSRTTDPDPEVRGWSAQCLYKLGDASVLERLHKEVTSSSFHTRKQAAKSLQAIASETSTKVLLEVLKDPEEELQTIAIQALGSIKDKQVIPELTKHLKSASAEKQCALLEALGKLNATEAIETLHSLLHSSEKTVQQTCIRVLGTLGNPESQGYLETFVQHDDKVLQDLAKQALTDIENFTKTQKSMESALFEQ